MMRVYGRTTDEVGNKSWKLIQTRDSDSLDKIRALKFDKVVIKESIEDARLWAGYGRIGK